MRNSIKGLGYFAATVKTAKHRIFVRLQDSALPDSKLIAIAINDIVSFGILSSRLHALWSMRLGSWMGVGNDSTYVKSICFDAFPFPEPDESAATKITTLAEQLDTHRKRQQEQHPGLTMTGMYNVLEKLRREEALTDKETQNPRTRPGLRPARTPRRPRPRRLRKPTAGTTSPKNSSAAPAPPPPGPKSPKTSRKPKNNSSSASSTSTTNAPPKKPKAKSAGSAPNTRPRNKHPNNQNSPPATKTPTPASRHPGPDPGTSAKKQTWPKTLQAQIRAVRNQLETAPMDAATLASHYKRKPEKSVTQVLEALTELGMIRQTEPGQYWIREG